MQHAIQQIVDDQAKGLRTGRPGSHWLEVRWPHSTTGVLRTLRNQLEERLSGSEAPVIASLGGQQPGVDPRLLSRGPVVLLLDHADKLFDWMSVGDQIRWRQTIDLHGSLSMIALAHTVPACVTEVDAPFRGRFQTVSWDHLMPSLAPLPIHEHARM